MSTCKILSNLDPYLSSLTPFDLYIFSHNLDITYKDMPIEHKTLNLSFDYNSWVKLYAIVRSLPGLYICTVYVNVITHKASYMWYNSIFINLQFVYKISHVTS